MSADNWAFCGFCVDDARNEWGAKVLEVRAAYGTLPLDEYEALRAGVPEEFDLSALKPTLREDWEIGFGSEPDTVGYLIYAASCSVCGAKAKVNSTVELRRP